MGKKGLLSLLFFIMLASSVQGAKISGNVYDISLDTVENARVGIDTSPRQSYIAKDGTYSFEVPIGEYTITADILKSGQVAESVSEAITVSSEGAYILDLIVFPSFSEEDELVSDSETDLTISMDEEEPESSNWWFIPLSALIIIAFFYYMIKAALKKEKRLIGSISESEEKDDEDYVKRVIACISKEGGRTTQKDIRKQVPLSEAKISLIIAELEHNGKIKKIKKGRGNIIILNK